MKEIIKADNLSFGYEKGLLLNSINFEVNRGDYVGIIGANGSAKSTLLKLIMGFLKPNNGSIKLFGRDVANFRDWHKVGYLPQNARDFNTKFPATVEEIVGSSQYNKMGIFKILNKNIKKATLSALRTVNMEGFKDSLLGNLSGGQQQRVFLAKLLVNNPEVVFMDEPLIGVDIESQNNFLDLIENLNKNLGITIIIVSHDIDAVYQRVDKILRLDNGKITIDNCENRNYLNKKNK